MNPQLERAVAVLRAGGLVAFPTETVYGLGADGRQALAVRRVFAVKGRPTNNPLIVHVADEARARRYAADWPTSAHTLAGSFWPGPLTLVVRKSCEIASDATAGGDTVGLRVPRHPLTLELLDAFDGPLVGPSANRSTRVSPTLATHVIDELGDAVDLVLDGGACEVGIESTVVDLTEAQPRVLRPGAVSVAQLESALGMVVAHGPAHAPPSDEPARSPGLQRVHYAPRVPAYRFSAGELSRAMAWAGSRDTLRIEVLAISAPRPGLPVHVRWTHMPDDEPGYARLLYQALRTADARSDAMLIELPPDHWIAIADRLARATQPLWADETT